MWSEVLMTYALIAHTPATLSATLGAHTITVILIAGAFIFGLSGGLAGALKGLDFFGVLVLAGVVGLSGGALRDIFLGIPAVVIFDWRIVLSVLCSGVLAFFLYHPLQRWTNSIQIIDALGLSIFSVLALILLCTTTLARWLRPLWAC